MLSDDVLPQPYRLINKIVQRCVSDALEEIGKRLNQGAAVGKSFRPLRTTPTVGAWQPQLNIAQVAPSPRAVHVAHPNAVVALTDGSVQILNLAMGMLQFQTPRIFADGAAIVAVSGGTAHNATTMYAAASASTVVIFTFDLPRPVSRESGAAAAAGRGSITPSSAPLANPVGRSAITPDVLSGALGADEAAGSATFRALCTIQVAEADGRISDVTLSPDGRFAAVAVNEGAAVLLFALPESITGAADVAPPAPPTVTFAGGSAGEGAAGGGPPVGATAATLIARVEPPKFVAGCLPASVGAPVARCAFLLAPPPPSLGYHRGGHSHSAAGPAAHTLVVAWIGANAFSRVALRDDTPGAADIVAMAKARSDAHFAAALGEAPLRDGAAGGGGGSAASAAAANASAKDAAAGNKGGGAKGAKGGKADAAGGGGGAGDGFPGGAGSGAAACPQEAIFSGVKEMLLPQILTALAVDDLGVRVALGMLDGIVFVYCGQVGRVIAAFNEAPHRESQRSVNLMFTKSLFFQGTSRLIVGHEVPNVESRSIVAVYDVDASVEQHRERTVSMAAPSDVGKGSKAGNGSDSALNTAGRVNRAPAPGLRGVRVALVPFVDRLHSAIPCGQLPIFLLTAAGLSFVLDSMSGAVLAKIETAALPPTQAIRHNDPRTAFAEAERVARTTAAFDSSAAVFAGSETLLTAACDEAVFVAYPLVAQAYRACSLDQLSYVLESVPPAQRDNYAQLTAVQLPNLVLGSFAKKPVSSSSSVKPPPSVAGTNTQHQLQHARSTRGGGSIAPVDVGTRGGSVAPSMTGTHRTGGGIGTAGGAPIALHPDASVSERVRAMIEARDTTRAMRAARLKQEWEAAKLQMR